jgi:hypothetical protein
VNYSEIIGELKKYPAKLIAVSKLQSEDKIRALYQKGQRAFAENYVQEALSKKMNLQDLCDLEWHFIGSLQKNKVKFVVGEFDLIHSVDSYELAQKIDQLAQQKKIQQKFLLQMNISNEPTKGGLLADELPAVIEKLKELDHLELKGLMTMPPLFDDPEKSRIYFKMLREMASRFKLPELSMGTSHDFQVALEEGATMIRLGEVLFGERPHKT